MAFKAPSKNELKSFNEEYDSEEKKSPELNQAMDALYNTESNDTQVRPDGSPVMSPAGAIGAAQIMPKTGPEAAKLAGLDWNEEKYKYDKDYNKALGKAYFENQLKKFGDYDKAFAAYNAGPNALQRAMAKASITGGDWKRHLPKETQDYIKKNLSKMNTSRSPAKEKKAKFDAPTEEELSSFNEESSLGQDLGDLAKSVGQGVTLGGGDEILGAAQALGDNITGDKSFKDLLESYRKHQKENEAEYEKVKERSPILSTVGEIGGGLLPGLATGGATAGMSLGGRLATMGSAGALVGGLSSKGNIEENPSELLTDTGIGTAMGLIPEAAISGAKKLAPKVTGPAVKKFKDIFEDYTAPRQHIKAFEEGLEGKGFFGDKNRIRLAEEAEAGAKEITGKFDKMREVASDAYGDVMKNAPEVSDYTASQLKNFDEAGSILDNMKSRTGVKLDEISGTLDQIRAGESVGAQELKNLQMFLRDNASKINQGETIDQILAAKSSADELLKTKVPGYSNVNEMFRKVEEPMEAFLTNTPSGEMSFGSKPSIKTQGTKEYQTAKKAIESSQRPFMAGQESFEKLHQLKKGLENLQKSNPEALAKMGIGNVDEFMKNIRDKSDVQSIMKTISGSGSLSQTGDLFGQGLRLSYGAANVAGQTARKASQIGKGLYNMPDNALINLSSKLRNVPGMGHLGTALEEAIQKSDSHGRNAVLFSIIQNPEARKEVENMVGVEDEQ
jgi:hypothetical protein